MERESGFYRVKYEGKWTVAEYISNEDSTLSYGDVWGLVGKQQFFTDRNFDVIDEEKIIFNETL